MFGRRQTLALASYLVAEATFYVQRGLIALVACQIMMHFCRAFPLLEPQPRNLEDVDQGRHLILAFLLTKAGTVGATTIARAPWCEALVEAAPARRTVQSRLERALNHREVWVHYALQVHGGWDLVVIVSFELGAWQERLHGEYRRDRPRFVLKLYYTTPAFLVILGVFWGVFGLGHFRV